MPNIPGSVPIGGFIAPYDAGDTYATQDSIYGRGGLREVASYALRNAITADRRRAGMLVCVQSDNTYWRLLPGPWVYTAADWAPFVTGGGGGTYLHSQPVAATVWTINHPLNGYPNVVVLDGGGVLIEGSIQYVTTAQIVLTFDTPISGLAQLN